MGGCSSTAPEISCVVASRTDSANQVGAAASTDLQVLLELLEAWRDCRMPKDGEQWAGRRWSAGDRFGDLPGWSALAPECDLRTLPNLNGTPSAGGGHTSGFCPLAGIEVDQKTGQVTGVYLQQMNLAGRWVHGAIPKLSGH